MGWQEDIRNYVPYNEHEEVDKEQAVYAMDTFDNLLTRENPIIHVTSSGYIVNKKRDKVLMVHHNIYKTWCWTGGHADGDADLLHVAVKEAREETGIKHIRAVSDKLLSLDVIEVVSHIKKEKYVSAHLHLNTCYLLEADENDELIIKKDENSGVMWIPIDEIDRYSNEPDMVILYKKFNEKIRSNNL